jgi:hypothetical protein
MESSKLINYLKKCVEVAKLHSQISCSFDRVELAERHGLVVVGVQNTQNRNVTCCGRKGLNDPTTSNGCQKPSTVTLLNLF